MGSQGIHVGAGDIELERCALTHVDPGADLAAIKIGSSEAGQIEKSVLHGRVDVIGAIDAAPSIGSGKRRESRHAAWSIERERRERRRDVRGIGDVDENLSFRDACRCVVEIHHRRDVVGIIRPYERDRGSPGSRSRQHHAKHRHQ